MVFLVLAKVHLSFDSQDLLQKIAPTWMNLSLKMKHDPSTDKEFGWVLEMWAPTLIEE